MMERNFYKQPLLEVNFIKEQIRQEGLAFFDYSFTKNSYIDFGKQFGRLYKHRDSDKSGVTVVANLKRNSMKPGYFGFSNSMLFPHTDRSTLSMPPNIVMLFCKKQSAKGGNTVLIDIKNVIKKMQKEYSSKLPLFDKDTVIFDDGNFSYKGSIVELLRDDSFFLRFRNDKFAFFNSDLIGFLPKFYKFIKENTLEIKLSENCGYIIHNGRYLHGRNSFCGEREMWRLLIHDNFLSYMGFKFDD